MSKALFFDLLMNWYKQTQKNYKLLASLFIVALPLSMLVNYTTVEKVYLDRSFAGLSDTSHLIKQVVLKEGSSTGPLDDYLANELSNQWPTTWAYERTLPLNVKIDFSHPQHANISFFSGGYAALNLIPFKGSLKSLDFPPEGNQVFAAISFHFWQNQLKQRKVIGEQLIIHDKAVTIAAILPPSFKSFRQSETTDIILPYNQLRVLLAQNKTQLTPDTFSYLLTDELTINESLAQEFTTFLQEQGLLLSDSKIELTDAFGIDYAQYQTLIQRLNILSIAFWILLLFCLVAFFTVFSGECQYKAQELAVRALCGGSENQIRIQGYIETMATAGLLAIITCCLTPLSYMLTTYLFPTFSALPALVLLKHYIPYLGLVLFISLFTMNSFYFLQSKFIHTPLGRGATTTTSQLIQSYALLALMLSLTCLTLYCTALLIKSQLNIYQTDLGFNIERKYFVSFEFPQDSDVKIFPGQSLAQLQFILRNHPEINHVAAAISLPLINRHYFSNWFLASGEKIGTGDLSNTHSNRISPDYFDTLEVPFLYGKSFAWQSVDQVIVNEALWQQFLAKEPLTNAKLIKLDPFSGKKHSYQVVGVVSNIRYQGPDSPAKPRVYELQKDFHHILNLVIDTTTSEAHLSEIILEATADFDVALNRVTLLNAAQLVEDENKPRLNLTIMMTGISLIILIAAIIFCTTSLSQLYQKNACEIALRFSIGASTFYQALSQSLLFLAIMLPALLVVLLLGIKNQSYIEQHLINVDIYTANYLLIAICLCLAIYLVVTGTLYKKITKNAWRYLN